jgi:hypothetical protein
MRTLSRPTGPREVLTMLATAPHAITAINQIKQGSANQRASRRQREQPDLSGPRAVVSGGDEKEQEDGLAGYRSECERPGRTGARRGCRRSGLRLPWRRRRGGPERVDCVGGWLAARVFGTREVLLLLRRRGVTVLGFP